MLMREKDGCWNFFLPCAGITLIRFYGYYLSLRQLANGTPGNAVHFFEMRCEIINKNLCHKENFPYLRSAR